MNSKNLIPIEKITTKIYLIRNEKVLLDADLAELYEVETRVLKQAVRRNLDRFPEDFMFQLGLEEWKSLRSQTVMLKRGQHSKYPPYAFTEQGKIIFEAIKQLIIEKQKPKKPIGFTLPGKK
jgi:hypothetical protein